jgi:polyisoprenoid-binding protein YceI
MDNNLYKALKADDAPEISYILATFDVVPGTEKDSFTVKAVGALTVAGTEKTVNMDVTAARLPDGGVRAEGALALLMTDFGVKPPTALLGTLRTDNKITVKFSLLVGPQTLSAALAGER